VDDIAYLVERGVLVVNQTTGTFNREEATAALRPIHLGGRLESLAAVAMRVDVDEEEVREFLEGEDLKTVVVHGESFVIDCDLCVEDNHGNDGGTHLGSTEVTAQELSAREGVSVDDIAYLVGRGVLVANQTTGTFNREEAKAVLRPRHLGGRLESLAAVAMRGDVSEDDVEEFLEEKGLKTVAVNGGANVIVIDTDADEGVGEYQG
jgi:hypothetical protein